MVAGAAALLLQKWPQLTGAQAGQILLDTAKDIGEPGVDKVFGHGLLDLKAALSPVNPTITGNASTVIGTSYAVVPAAVDATVIGHSLGSVTVLDQYGRDFHVDLSNHVLQSRSASPSVVRQTLQMQQDRSSSFGDARLSGQFAYRFFGASAPAGAPQAEFASGFVSGTTGTVEWSLGFNQSYGGDPATLGLGPVRTAVAAYAPQADRSAAASLPFHGGRIGFSSSLGRTRFGSVVASGVEYSQPGLSLRVDLIQEHGSLFGAPSRGAFSLGDASSVVVDARRTIGLGSGWALDMHGSLGWTRLARSDSSVFTGGQLLSTRYGVAIGGPVGRGDHLSFGVEQPLTVEGGTIGIDVGNRYDLDRRALVMAHRFADARSPYRPVVFTGGYSRLIAGGLLRFGGTYDAARSNASALFNFRTSF